MFVVNHGSVTPGYDRKDFDTLMKHGVSLLRQMDRFVRSVALIVSKTPSVRNRGVRMFDVPEISSNLLLNASLITAMY